MKIRNGFVSNSSSSSFIIIAPRNKNTINTLKDIKKYLLSYYGEDFVKYNLKDFVLSVGKDKIKEAFNNNKGFIFFECEQNSINDLMNFIKYFDNIEIHNQYP